MAATIYSMHPTSGLVQPSKIGKKMHDFRSEVPNVFSQHGYTDRVVLIDSLFSASLDFGRKSKIIGRSWLPVLPAF